MREPQSPDEGGTVVAREPTPPYERTFDRPVVDRKGRKIQRLTLRGRVSIKVQLTNPKVREVWDGRSTHTWFTDLPVPVWSVLVERPSRTFFKAIAGWDNVHTENIDLDAALDEALALTEPNRLYLHDHVYEHREWTRDFAVMAGRIGGDNTCLMNRPNPSSISAGEDDRG